MRSTLLFVAVLLACTPVHAQAAAPVETPILHAWLAAIFPATAPETTRKTVLKRRNPAAIPTLHAAQAARPFPEPTLPTESATLLTHDSNAP
jgi:hypothetical protein